MSQLFTIQKNVIIFFLMVVSLFRIIKFYCLKFKLNISPTPKSTQIHFSLLLAFNCGTKYKPITMIEKKKKKSNLILPFLYSNV
jgi:biotin transporter BioY